jgi:membrane protein implicated in regulation of membrane protease activity
MTDVSRRPEGESSRGLWILVLLLLAPAVVVPLLVPLYDKADPTLWGFPFFYWFQFALILGSAVLTVTAFAVAREASRRDRATRGIRNREAGDR